MLTFFGFFLQGDPQRIEQMMASLKFELHPVPTNESPHINDFGTRSRTTDIPTQDNNQGPSAASNEEESTILVVRNGTPAGEFLLFLV